MGFYLHEQYTRLYKCIGLYYTRRAACNQIATKYRNILRYEGFMVCGFTDLHNIQDDVGIYRLELGPLSTLRPKSIQTLTSDPIIQNLKKY